MNWGNHNISHNCELMFNSTFYFPNIYNPQEWNRNLKTEILYLIASYFNCHASYQNSKPESRNSLGERSMVNSLLYRLGPETLFTRDLKRQIHFPGFSTRPWRMYMQWERVNWATRNILYNDMFTRLIYHCYSFNILNILFLITYLWS